MTMDYQIRRELFESIASDITCYFCKIVPRKGMPNFRIDKKFREIKSPPIFQAPFTIRPRGSLCVHYVVKSMVDGVMRLFIRFIY